MTNRWRTLLILTALVACGAGPRQGADLHRVMGEKLDHAEQMLRAVVTSDWIALEAHSRELERLMRDQRWTVLNYPEYARHSDAFRRAVQAVHTAAVQRDLERAPQAYSEMTLRCVDCHRYLARARIAE